MKTSIIILTHNQLNYTQMCIDSIRQYTMPEQYQIIIIDNNSNDGTVKWLKHQTDLTVIYNEQNLGFPRGCNQGIEIATGNNILLLNNDVIVTQGWLDNLLNCLYSSESIGAVGAVTNNCSYYQTVNVDYKNIPQMHAFAKKFNQSNPSLWQERLKLVGFCLLIKRAVVDKVGCLDECFTPGNFEDDDYSLRIRLAGYKLMLCKDVFIHHFGSVSFKKDNVKYGELLQINRQKFLKKWGFDSTYSTSIRHEIINLIDQPGDQPLKVLEIGCACGGTLLQIKNLYQNSQLFGIELNEQAATSAKLFADVIAADIEKTVLPYQQGYFDYIILADVLEHLSDPEQAIINIRNYLKPTGQLLASIPNVMHFSVVRDLLQGNWSYQDAGILDKTHLRFFTLNEINKMFTNAGYIVSEYQSTTIGETEADTKFIQALANFAGNSGLTVQYRAYQYLVKAATALSQTPQTTPQINLQQLTFLLRRIEQGINIDDNLQTLVDRMLEENITAEQIIHAVMLGMIHKEAVLSAIAVSCYQNKLVDHSVELLMHAYKINPQNAATIYNLAYIVYKLGEVTTALNLLTKLKIKDDKTKELLEEIMEMS